LKKNKNWRGQAYMWLIHWVAAK